MVTALNHIADKALSGNLSPGSNADMLSLERPTMLACLMRDILRLMWPQA
jgi:hypothetical protein